jgi:hypothetical protein
MRFGKKVYPRALMMIIVLSGSRSLAAVYNVALDPFGWSPSPITIQTGDSVRFHNFTGAEITVYQGDGDCPPWYVPSIPNNSYGQIQFNCGPGTEVYLDTYISESGIIVIANPTPSPTPTPDPAIGFPTMTPAGILILLVVMGFAVGVSRLRNS